MKIRNSVAILYSPDSNNGISFMPYTPSNSGWEPGKAAGAYGAMVQQLHEALYKANVGADFVFPSNTNFSQYKLLIVPLLYVSDDALLKRISDYVHDGGHVLMTFKSGFTNENSAVRWEKAPGPLRDAAGFTYQEFSNLEKPLLLRDDPFHVGDGNRVSQWAEFLQLTTAKSLATYDHPFFGHWPAITENQFGKGTLIYEGTALSDVLQQAVVMRALQTSGVPFNLEAAQSTIRVKSGVNAFGRRLIYLLNYSSTTAVAKYDGPPAHDVLTKKSLSAGQTLSIQPWDLVIAESDSSENGASQ
jgi:beta-galactosidase